jgi:hypothetical protein
MSVEEIQRHCRHSVAGGWIAADGGDRKQVTPELRAVCKSIQTYSQLECVRLLRQMNHGEKETAFASGAPMYFQKQLDLEQVRSCK